MYPACLRGPVTAGPDGIRLSEGRRRDALTDFSAGGVLPWDQAKPGGQMAAGFEL